MLMVGAVVAPAFASTSTVRVNDQGFVLGGSEGDVISLDSVPVSSEYQGQTCTVTVSTQNNFSVHEGNVLTVSSGDSSSEVVSVEGEADGAVSESFDLTLGSTIDLSLRLGETGSSSLTAEVTQDCSGAEIEETVVEVEAVVAETCDSDATEGSDSDSSDVDSSDATSEACETDCDTDSTDGTTGSNSDTDSDCDAEVVVESVVAEIPVAAPAQAVVGSPVYAG